MEVSRTIPAPKPRRFPSPAHRLPLRDFLVSNHNNSQVFLSPRGTYSPDVQEQYETSLVDRETEYREPITAASLTQPPPAAWSTAPRDIPAIGAVVRDMAIGMNFAAMPGGLTREQFLQGIDAWENLVLTRPEHDRTRRFFLSKLIGWNTRDFTIKSWCMVVQWVASFAFRIRKFGSCQSYDEETRQAGVKFALFWHGWLMADTPHSLMLALYLINNVFE